MASFVVLLLCAISGLTLCSTSKPLEEMNMEDAVLYLGKQISNMEKTQEELLVEIKRVEKNYLADKNEISSKLEQVLNKVSEIEKIKFTLQTNVNDINKINGELSRIQTVCSPPCENGGQCVKNVCNCPSLFTGDRCQQVVCIPPCENGGRCMRNNVCDCALSFYGDRCRAQCGIDFDNGENNNKGGNISSSRLWPWMAAVYRTFDTKHICDGSVIHPHFVLTSAACLDWYGSEGLFVKLGLGDLKNGTHLQEYKVGSVYTHPQSKSGRYDYNNNYNMALLKVEEDITFDPFVRPVCLPPPEILQNDTLHKPQSTAKAVDLFGYIEATSTSRNAPLIMLNLTILSPRECGRIKSKEGLWNIWPSANLSFCAESSSTTCLEIKYGTPVLQSRLSGDGTRTWTQVGIASQLSNCKYFFSPRHLREWVETTIAASSKQ